MSRAREWIEDARRERGGEPPRGNGHGKDEPPLGPRPVIIVRPGERHLAADEGLAALAMARTRFYRRFTELVHVVRVEGKDAHGSKVWTPGVSPIDLATLQRALAYAAVWQKPKGKGFVMIDPPEAVAKQIMVMIEEWPFPVLRGVIATPTLRFDGSVLDKPGYDERTGLYLVDPPKMPPMPENPSLHDALAGLDTLNYLFEEVRFAKDDEMSRSAALSMLMTMVLRGMMNVAPLHAVSKPAAGTGGSYLCDLAAMLATGERCPVITPSEDTDELEKRLVAAALAGQPIIALDNMSSMLEGDFLCQLVERPRPQVRRLGTSQLFTLDNTWSTLANGNQLQIRGDMVRRTVAIGLDADMENPDEREFQRDPLAEIAADRGRYIAAILTIARAYILAGRPGRLPAKPSFEEWSDNIRSAINWLNWPDPASSAQRLRADDPTRRQRNTIFHAWSRALVIGTSYYTRELVAKAAMRPKARHDDTDEIKEKAKDEAQRYADLESAFAEVAPGKNAPVDPLALAKWLSRNLDAIALGTKLVADRSDAARPKWRLVTVDL